MAADFKTSTAYRSNLADRRQLRGLPPFRPASFQLENPQQSRPSSFSCTCFYVYSFFPTNWLAFFSLHYEMPVM